MWFYLHRILWRNWMRIRPTLPHAVATRWNTRSLTVSRQLQHQSVVDVGVDRCLGWPAWDRTLNRFWVAHKRRRLLQLHSTHPGAASTSYKKIYHFKPLSGINTIILRTKKERKKEKEIKILDANGSSKNAKLNKFVPNWFRVIFSFFFWLNRFLCLQYCRHIRIRKPTEKSSQDASYQLGFVLH